jgi:hypothetical protein
VSRLAGRISAVEAASLMDPSLKPDPSRKGSYYRRIADVARGLDSLQVKGLPETMRFFAYYFGCEKIARGLLGIHGRLPATTAYSHKHGLKLNDIKVAVAALGLNVSTQDLDWLFADFHEQHVLQATSSCTNSARYLRNLVTHDFGPSNVARVIRHAPFHNIRMEVFLGCVPTIFEYQELHFSGIA